MSGGSGTPESGHTCPTCGAKIRDPIEGCPRCAATRAPGSATIAADHAGPRQIAGYRIIREVGAGGMGTVFEAHETEMNRRVALKVMSRHHSSSEKAEARFAREAWIGGKLNHPNLVKVYERGSWEELSYYSMELVDGGSLHDVIRRMKQWGSDDVWGLQFGTHEYIAWVIAQIVAAARGLQYAHRHGVIHRDVKPMNILLSRDPCAVKLADFGLAMDLDTTRLTTAGSVLGTVAYMAPEQIRGDATLIDARVDIYALGVTLFELLTLELPFTGATHQLYVNAVLTAQARRPRKLNEKVGRDLEVVLGKTLEKHPRDRYASAAELADDLENVLGFRPIRARPPGPAVRIVKWARRKPVHAALAAALVAGLPTVAALTVRHVQSQGLLEKVEIDRLWEEARRAERQDRFAEEAGLLSRILERDPRHVPALRARTAAYYELSRAEPDDLERSKLQSLALADISRIVDLLPRASWPYRFRAFLLAGFGRVAEAGEDEETARRLATDTLSEEDLQIEAFLRLRSGDYPSAAETLSELIVRMPGAVDYILDRAGIYERMGETSQAINDYRVAIGLNPAEAHAHQKLGDLLTLTGDLKRGESEYQQVLKLKPGYPDAHEGLANNLLQQGGSRLSEGDRQGALADFQRAEREARRAVELDPNRPWSRVNLGASLMEQNRLRETPDPELIREAIAHYEQVISDQELRGEDLVATVYLDTLVNLCDARIQTRDLEGALSTCRKVADRRPDDATGFYNLAAVYALLGRRDESFEALEKDVALGDTDHGYLAADRWFESLRGDPRFKALLRRMERPSAASAARDSGARP